MKNSLNIYEISELIAELQSRGYNVFQKCEIDLLHDYGYFACFFEFSQNAKSYKEAWELTEQKLMQNFGVTRYVNYDSFRSAFWRYRKRIKKKNNRSGV